MDDFKLINGIGPAIERRLHEVGVTTFAQLAALSPDGLATLVEGAGVSPERIVKQDWIGRAGELASVSTESAEASAKARKQEEEAKRDVATVAPPVDTGELDGSAGRPASRARRRVVRGGSRRGRRRGRGERG